MPYSAKAPASSSNLNYGRMNRNQKSKAKDIVLSYYFSRWDNAPSDIALLSGYKLTVVQTVLNKHIVAGADLVELKKLYKK